MASAAQNSLIIRPYCSTTDFESVVNHLQNIYLLDSPLFSGLDFSKEEMAPILFHHLEQAKIADLSYVACDSTITEKDQSIIGCVLASIVDQDEPMLNNSSSLPLTSSKERVLADFVEKMFKDPLLEFSMARILKLDIFSVSSVYRGKGLCKKMVELCLQDSLVRRSCDVAVSLATSHKSQALLLEQKFITVKMCYFDEYNEQQAEGHLRFNMKDSRNTNAKVLARILTS